MTASFNPTGLTPTRIRGAAPNSNGTNEYPIKSGTAATIFKGAPVRVSVGNLVAMVSIGEAPIGVFQGCRYVENGEQKFKSFFPGGTSVTDAVGFVTDNPAQTYVIQADATISAAIVGKNISFKDSLTSGSTFTGQSGASGDASTVASTGLDLKVIRVVDEPGNKLDDAFTKIEVMLNNHADNFRNVFVTAPVTTTN